MTKCFCFFGFRIIKLFHFDEINNSMRNNSAGIILNPSQKYKIDAQKSIEINCVRQKGSHISDKNALYSLENIQFTLCVYACVHYVSSESYMENTYICLFQASISQIFLHCPICHKLSSEKETPLAAIKMLSVTIQTIERPNLTSGVLKPNSKWKHSRWK